MTGKVIQMIRTPRNWVTPLGLESSKRDWAAKLVESGVDKWSARATLWQSLLHSSVPCGRRQARPKKRWEQDVADYVFKIIADLGVRRFDIEPLAGSNCELVGDLVEAQAPLGKLRAPLWKLRLPCGGADIVLGTQDTGHGNP